MTFTSCVRCYVPIRPKRGEGLRLADRDVSRAFQAKLSEIPQPLKGNPESPNAFPRDIHSKSAAPNGISSAFRPSG